MRKATKWVLIVVGVGILAAAAFLGGQYVLSAPPAPTVADISYGSNPAQRFDLWKPAGKGPFPVVLTVHGGAFLFGDKRSHDGLKADIEALTSHGIALASTNYRMSGEAKFPAAAQDVSAALVELHRRAADLGLDSNRIALWGKSAGGNLVLLAGLANGRSPIGNGTSVPLSAIVAMYPPVRFDRMDEQLRSSACGSKAANHDAADSPESQWLGAPLATRPDLVGQASPLTYVTAAAPPMLVQAGGSDCMVPHEQSMMLATALRGAGAQVELDIVPDAQHIDPVFDEPKNLAKVVSFFEAAFAGKFVAN